MRGVPGEGPGSRVSGGSDGSQKEAARQIKTNGSWQAAQQKSAV